MNPATTNEMMAVLLIGVPRMNKDTSANINQTVVLHCAQAACASLGTECCRVVVQHSPAWPQLVSVGSRTLAVTVAGVHWLSMSENGKGQGTYCSDQTPLQRLAHWSPARSQTRCCHPRVCPGNVDLQHVVGAVLVRATQHTYTDRVSIRRLLIKQSIITELGLNDDTVRRVDLNGLPFHQTDIIVGATVRCGHWVR